MTGTAIVVNSLRASIDQVFALICATGQLIDTVALHTAELGCPLKKQILIGLICRVSCLRCLLPTVLIAHIIDTWM